MGLKISEIKKIVSAAEKKAQLEINALTPRQKKDLETKANRFAEKSHSAEKTA